MPFIEHRLWMTSVHYRRNYLSQRLGPICGARAVTTTDCCQLLVLCLSITRGVRGNGEDWDPMGMGVRSAMGWEWDGNGD